MQRKNLFKKNIKGEGERERRERVKEGEIASREREIERKSESGRKKDMSTERARDLQIKQKRTRDNKEE